ncbi:hypothetical protein PNU79_10845 [Turicibacter sanguinis]|uniref:hypothetical protein n=1 Tax=Turicibacter sanguinis TaxID=154288 RepID=UPI00232FC466|nr:hypothetical protein [Turicibacter sanguinis]MDB8542497.1 hypothetical protein [Turicibacter sanguinis]
MLIFGFKLLDKLQENPGEFLQKIALIFLKVCAGLFIAFFIIASFGIILQDSLYVTVGEKIISIIMIAIATIVAEATPLLIYGILYGLGRLVATNQKQLEILEKSTLVNQQLSQKIQDDELPML